MPHVCQQGIRDSQGLLQKLVGMERNEQFADGILPKIHISGCPSSCGTHQIGVIGFRGGAKTIDKVLKPAFNLYINGSDIQGQERMGEEVGTLLEEQIPDFLCALGHAVSDSGMDFDTWFAKNPGRHQGHCSFFPGIKGFSFKPGCCIIFISCPILGGNNGIIFK